MVGERLYPEAQRVLEMCQRVSGKWNITEGCWDTSRPLAKAWFCFVIWALLMILHWSKVTRRYWKEKWTTTGNSHLSLQSKDKAHPYKMHPVDKCMAEQMVQSGGLSLLYPRRFNEPFIDSWQSSEPIKWEQKLWRLLCKSIEESFNPGPRLVQDSGLQMSVNNADLLTWTKAKKLKLIFAHYRVVGLTKGIIE